MQCIVHMPPVGDLLQGIGVCYDLQSVKHLSRVVWGICSCYNKQ